MGIVRASIIGTDAVRQLLLGQHPRWLQHGPFPMHPLRLDRVQPRALAWQQAGTMRTPVPSALTCRLWLRIHVRTIWRLCHDTLSHTSSRARLPCAASRSVHHARNWVVSSLTGCPLAKRSQICSGVVGVARSSSP